MPVQRRHQLVRRQTSDELAVPSATGLQGGATASSGVTIASSLLLGPSASPVPSGSDALDPSESANTITAAQSGSTSTSPASALTNPSISTGAVIGIAVGVFLATVAAMFAMYAFFKKRSLARARRPVTRGFPPAVRGTGGAAGNSKGRQWHRMEDGHDDREGREKSSPGLANPPRSKTPDCDKFALFEKDPSVRSLSDDKANHSFDPSTMPNFAKYHPSLAEALSTAQPHPPFASRADGPQIISWDSETMNGGSFLSMLASPSDTMSPTAVIARQTPQTTDSAQHHWESAEVHIMDEPTTARSSIYSHPTENPFSDDAAARASNEDTDSRTTRGNPFFNASQHANPFSDRASRSRKSSVSTVKRPRSYSASTTGAVRPGANENALLSLIAALNATPVVPDDRSSRYSMQSMATATYQAESSAVPTIPKAF
ncbi:hypothetical protein BJV78DRAFT_1180575 [Lactifluus subvellereus]|nr:hypothetical protein BJV78DRAFT_1180575 [Lactifluus subvellereus]